MRLSYWRWIFPCYTLARTNLYVPTLGMYAANGLVEFSPPARTLTVLLSIAFVIAVGNNADTENVAVTRLTIAQAVLLFIANNKPIF
jgi:hypothetical protein